ncbi:MAG: hypothetical protein J5680_07925 [Neisseriaceae bacterium]|nr:hypothetical protein [Neisseriaceae bacterium]
MSSDFVLPCGKTDFFKITLRFRLSGSLKEISKRYLKYIRQSVGLTKSLLTAHCSLLTEKTAH